MLTIINQAKPLPVLEEAIAQANQLLQRPAFYDGIRQHPAFDKTDVAPAVIAQLLADSPLVFRVRTFVPGAGQRKTLAYVDADYPETLFLNQKKLETGEGWDEQHFAKDVAATIIHECVHAVDQAFPDYRFGHGDNRRRGKDNTAPYWIGNYAYQLMVGAPVLALAFDRVEEPTDDAPVLAAVDQPAPAFGGPAAAFSLASLSPLSPLSAMPELTLFNNGPQKQYTKEMKNRFGYYAAWDPGIPCALGDIGVLKNNVFTRLGSLTEQGIPFEALLDTTPVDMDYESRGSVTTTLKASGAATPTGSGLGQLDAGIIIEFSKANAVVFRAQSCLTHQLKDTIRLGAAVLEQFRAGRWDKNWVVITSLVEAKSATIVISKQAQGKIELKATANISAPKLDVADGSFAFAQSFVRGIDTKIIAQAGLTPLFNVMGIKNTLFAPPAFKVQGVDGMSRLTPQLATDDLKDSISFGYITSTPNQ